MPIQGPGAEQVADYLLERYDGFSAEMLKHLDEPKLHALAKVFLVLAARISFRSADTQREVFQQAEKFGVHFMPVHFYSPVPSRTEIDERVYQRRYDWIPNLQIDKAAHVAWLDRFATYAGELADVPALAPPDESFYWSNPAFAPGDAIALYGMIRETKPRRIVEIGSGHSTRLALRALARNGSGEVACVEPYPMPSIRRLAESGSLSLIERKVQDVDTSTFSDLEAGDILFIDSSHVSKIGSDVNHEIFEILPRLKSGVMVHIHDMFFPWDVHREWIEKLNLFWNEQYLVMAFLAYNDRFKIELANQYVGRELGTEHRERFSMLAGAEVAGGGSLWLRTV
jgi:Methyltransferase domain